MACDPPKFDANDQYIGQKMTYRDDLRSSFNHEDVPAMCTTPGCSNITTVSDFDGFIYPCYECSRKREMANNSPRTVIRTFKPSPGIYWGPSIFVFGSNLAGRHGKGSALEAVKNHGAKYGVGFGPTGNAYAIPTKDEKLNILPLTTIAIHVSYFIQYAKSRSETLFNIVAIGCGLAGYKPEEIAPMFREAPSNCKLPIMFIEVLSRNVRKNNSC